MDTMPEKKEMWELITDKANKFLKNNAKTDVNGLLAKAGEFIADCA